MNHLTRTDYATALSLVARLAQASTDAASFAREAVVALSEFVACEFATLSVCDLVSGHREVVGLPGVRLATDDIECFDRHFFEHPLVRRHGLAREQTTLRISDSLSRREFHDTALYADYYRRIGLEHAVAVPLYVDGRTLVSLVLNRRGLDFGERDRERLEVLRPHLAHLYRSACRESSAMGSSAAANALRPAAAQALPAGLTPREREVLRWLAHGKTDHEIAAVLTLSPRTVQKHLEHIYVKLGVETRTAAVMRALTMSSPDGQPLALVALSAAYRH